MHAPDPGGGKCSSLPRAHADTERTQSLAPAAAPQASEVFAAAPTNPPSSSP